MKRIDLDDDSLEIVKSILQKYEDHFVFYAFGSRVTGKAKKYSDLDIAYEKNGTVSISNVKSDFEDSNLAIIIDLVDLDSVSAQFEKIIRNEMVPFLSEYKKR